MVEKQLALASGSTPSPRVEPTAGREGESLRSGPSPGILDGGVPDYWILEIEWYGLSA